VNYVELGSVRSVSQSGDQAVVYAELVYVMNDGSRGGDNGEPYIHLRYDTASGQWRFDDKRASP
jgi:hypothetical protein